MTTVLTTGSADEIRTLLRWHVLTARASALGQPWPAWTRNSTASARAWPAAPPRERRRSPGDHATAVPSAVEAVRRDLLPRHHAARHHADGGPHQGRVRAAPAHQPLARRAHPRRRAGQAGQGRHPGGLPAAVDRLQPHRHPARRPLRQRPARQRLPAAARPRQAGPAGGGRALCQPARHHADLGERRLQPADQQHRHHRRHRAAAVLRARGRRGGELLHHRRGHRPRADARLRQQRPPLRRRPATCATGGRRRPRPSSRSAPTCWCSSTASSRCCRA